MIIRAWQASLTHQRILSAVLAVIHDSMLLDIKHDAHHSRLLVHRLSEHASLQSLIAQVMNIHILPDC